MGAAHAQAGLSATARRYARSLLDAVGAMSPAPLALVDEHPAVTWARSGLMALTGNAPAHHSAHPATSVEDGAPQMCPVPLAACADGVLAALASFASPEAFAGLRGSQLLAERAAIAGLSRRGSISPGGGCRLLETGDGRIAVNLARDADWELVAAWLETDAHDWDALGAAVRQRGTAALVARAQDLGLAVCADVSPPAVAPPWFRICAEGPRAPQQKSRPRVVDLSSLWAGPLCGALLLRFGAEVIKVESTQRPDGARLGPARFFSLLNDGKTCVSLDFGAQSGRRRLRELIDSADIVIEASRPRALRQLGIEAQECVRGRAGLTWLSLTGHGRTGTRENRIAYGDDAGVAAGLSFLMAQASGAPLFCGDAISDPLTGMHAALAGWALHRNGGGALVDVNLVDVTAHVAAFDCPPTLDAVRERMRQWGALALAAGVAAPRARGSA